MFEKEAEKYASDLELIYKKGVLDGYNKCKEELNQNGLALQSDMDKTIEQNIALKKELNKANEWHNVKDGNPNNENDILCQISKDEVVVGYYHTVAKRYITIDGQDLYNVIAWKEIVLPE